MTYATIHLHITSYPSPTSMAAINYACAMAKLLEANLEASSSQLSFRSPGNWLTGAMMAKMARELEIATAETTAALESHLET